MHIGSSFQYPVNPCIGVHDSTEAILRYQYGPVKLFGCHRSAFARECQRPRRIGGELNRVAQMKRAPGGGVATILRHVAAHRERVDTLELKPFFKVRFGETVGPVLFYQCVAMPLCNVRMDIPFPAAFAKDGRSVRLGRVLDYHHGDALRGP